MTVEETKGGWKVKVLATNIGEVAGKDVVQIYVKAPGKELDKPELELKGFAKTPVLNPGESYNVEIFISKESLASFDDAAGAWKLEKGSYTFIAAKHSLDKSQKAKISIR
jgi:beta-glucosidase